MVLLSVVDWFVSKLLCKYVIVHQFLQPKLSGRHCAGVSYAVQNGVVFRGEQNGCIAYYNITCTCTSFCLYVLVYEIIVIIIITLTQYQKR